VRLVVSEGCDALGLGAFAGGGTVAVSRLTLVVSPDVTVDATMPALESRMGAAAGTLALADSSARAVSKRLPPSFVRHASAPSNTVPMYIL